MDTLTRLHVEASVLLGRVDESLARHGAPADHPIWPLLRRRGLLPGDAVANVVAWIPHPLLERARLLRGQRERCLELGDVLRPPSGWEGGASAAFAAQLSATLAAHDALARRAGSSADRLEALGDWIIRGRRSLAGTLAMVLTSGQAVTVRASVGLGSGGAVGLAVRAHAAADLGAEVLGEIDRFWTGALQICDGRGDEQDGAAIKTEATAEVAVTLRASFDT